MPQLTFWFDSDLFRPKNLPNRLIFGQVRCPGTILFLSMLSLSVSLSFCSRSRSLFLSALALGLSFWFSRFFIFFVFPLLSLSLSLSFCSRSRSLFLDGRGEKTTFLTIFWQWGSEVYSTTFKAVDLNVLDQMTLDLTGWYVNRFSYPLLECNEIPFAIKCMNMSL